MLHVMGVVCITLAVILEFASYYKQVAKTLRTKKSAHVSSSSYLLKIAKYLVTITGLAIYANWVGVGIEIAALAACVIVLYIVAKYKPKGWRLFS
jgi:uncharacterized protein with PQ loop repeat